MDGGIDETSTVGDEVETGDAGDAEGVAGDGTAGWETGGEGGDEGGRDRGVRDSTVLVLFDGGAGAFEGRGGSGPEDGEEGCDATSESAGQRRGQLPKRRKKKRRKKTHECPQTTNPYPGNCSNASLITSCTVPLCNVVALQNIPLWTRYSPFGSPSGRGMGS